MMEWNVTSGPGLLCISQLAKVPVVLRHAERDLLHCEQAPFRKTG